MWIKELMKKLPSKMLSHLLKLKEFLLMLNPQVLVDEVDYIFFLFVGIFYLDP